MPIMADRNDTVLEQVISRLSLEPGVSAVSWKVVENGAAWKQYGYLPKFSRIRVITRSEGRGRADQAGMWGAGLPDSSRRLRNGTRKDSTLASAADTKASSTGQGPSPKVLNRRRLSSPAIGLSSSLRTATLLPQTRKLHLHRTQ